jgi:hypothetical protein
MTKGPPQGAISDILVIARFYVRHFLALHLAQSKGENG